MIMCYLLKLSESSFQTQWTSLIKTYLGRVSDSILTAVSCANQFFYCHFLLLKRHPALFNKVNSKVVVRFCKKS